MQPLAPILAVISSDAADLSGVPASAPAGANAPAFDATMAAALADGEQYAPVSAVAAASDAAPAIATSTAEDAALAALASASELAGRGVTARQPGPNLIRLVVTTPGIAVDQIDALPARVEPIAATGLQTGADGVITDPATTRLRLATGETDDEPTTELAIGAQPPVTMFVANRNEGSAAADDGVDAVTRGTMPSPEKAEAANASESVVAGVATILASAAHLEAEAQDRIATATAPHLKKRNDTISQDPTGPAIVLPQTETDDLDAPIGLGLPVVAPAAPQGPTSSDTASVSTDAAPPPLAAPTPAVMADAPVTPVVSPAAATVTEGEAPSAESDRQLAKKADADDETKADGGDDTDLAAAPDRSRNPDIAPQQQIMPTAARASADLDVQNIRFDGPRARREQFLNLRASLEGASSNRAFAMGAAVADADPTADAMPTRTEALAQPAPSSPDEQARAPDPAPEAAEPQALTITVNGQKTPVAVSHADSARTPPVVGDRLGALVKLGVRDIEITTHQPTTPADVDPPNVTPVEAAAPAPRAAPQDQPASGAQATGSPAAADTDRRAIAADLRVRAMERQVIAAARAGSDEVRMQLYPPGLGQVIIRLTMDGSRLRLSTRTQSQEATDALKEGETSLRDALAVGGFDLTDFDVSDQGSNESEPRRKTPETPHQTLDKAPAEAFAVDMNA